MKRRLALALTGAALFSLVGWRPESPGVGPSSSGETPVAHALRRSPLAEATLLARERENGCVEGSAAAPEPQSWPDWAKAHIAGGDVPPARVVADPYPTLHSVAVDPEHNRVVVSDPNRHALWTYDRLAASAGGAGRAADRHPRTLDRDDVHRRGRRRSEGAGSTPSTTTSAIA